MIQTQISVKHIAALLGLIFGLYLMTSLVFRAFGMCGRPSHELQLSLFNDLICIPNIQTSLTPLPTTTTIATPSIAPSPQIDNSQGQYYIKFTIDGVNKVFLNSRLGGVPSVQALSVMTHRAGIQTRGEIEADTGPNDTVGESMHISLQNPNNVTSYFTYKGAGKTLYEGDCTITITEFAGMTGNLKGGGTCNALSDLQDKTSVIKTLTEVEFNVKRRGETHAIE